MSPADFKAMYELASEMKTGEAARFIRSELDCGLAGTFPHLRKVVDLYPESMLANDQHRSAA